MPCALAAAQAEFGDDALHQLRKREAQERRAAAEAASMKIDTNQIPLGQRNVVRSFFTELPIPASFTLGQHVRGRSSAHHCRVFVLVCQGLGWSAWCAYGWKGPCWPGREGG